ncbi:MAG TPA: chromate efflux transporter [Polyangiaceae bacterium]|nr:chromate efflux transporter [Polyangiaceae bacterium]
MAEAKPSDSTTEPAPARVSFAAAARVWLRIGLLSFGGPAGQIALMHRELVEKRHWIDEARFLHALNYCMLLPGPEAQQLATYIGWLMHRTRGGLFAGISFVLPGFLVVLTLSALYAELRELPLVGALFFGLKAAVLAVVLEALMRIGRRALKTRFLLLLAALAFVAIHFLRLPFPLIVVGAAALGFIGRRWTTPGSAATKNADGPAGQSTIEQMAQAGELEHTRPSLGRAVRVLFICLPLWALPVALAWLVFGRDSVLVKEAWLFSKLAVVTFGGAYAVLSYVAQQAVDAYGWLTAGEMLDGLGLAETTPGPLILVLEFVGFMASFRHAGEHSPWLMGLLGALMTVWVTFVPCFLWIFLGAPYIETLRKSRALSSMLSAITAAVVGVILNLSLWFGLHVLFGRVDERSLGPVTLLLPAPATLDPWALALSALALVLLFRVKLGLGFTLAIAAGLGAAIKLVLR